MTDIKQQLDSIFYPESIAMIGASPNLYKWGSFLFANLLKGGYKNAYPVNPKQDSIFGRECYANVLDTPDPLDLAIIAVPAAHVKQAVADCVEKGVKGILLITSGFSETDENGTKLEKEIVDMVKKANIRMIGPNTMGIMNTHHNLTVIGSHIRPPKGNISLISQSGNLGAQVLAWAENMGIGINKFVGSGNEGDLHVTDYLNYLHQDETTKIILVYFEGVEDGREFLAAAKRISKDKPIIALKGGRTEAGSAAAKSHTGSMAGSYEVTQGALKQAGVIIADNPTELIDFSIAFEHLPLPKGNRVGISTLGGGWGVIAADQCNERGFVLPDLPQDVIEEVNKLLPSFWSKHNPLDLVGQIDPRAFRKAVNLLAAADSFDAVLALGGLGSSSFIYRVVAAARDVDPAFNNDTVQLAISESAKLEARQLRDVAQAMAEYNKPVLTVSHSEKLQYAIPINDKVVVAYPTPEKAIRVLQVMLEYSKWRMARGLD